MSVAPPITTHIDRASFGIYSKDEIKQISVKKLTEPKTFEKAGAMHPEGLYAPALGPCKRFELCPTCGLSDIGCPGHFGHIELSVPVYHPMLVQVMYQMLSKCCLECFHFRLSQPLLKLFLAQLEALNCGFDHLIEELDELAADMCKDTKNDAGDPYLHVTLGKKLLARIQEEKDKTPDFDCQKRPQQRAIVERLSKIFRNFITGTLIKPLRACPNCGEKKASLALHQQSVLVLGMNSSKPLTEAEAAKPSRAKRMKKTKQSSSEQSSNKEVKNEHDLHYLKNDEKKFVTPIGARHYFRELWKNEKKTMQRIFHFLNIEKHEKDEIPELDDPKAKLKAEAQFQPVDLFFVDTILVPPSKFRPPMSQRGYSFEGPRTAALSNVMKCSVIVQDLIDQMISESDEIEAEKLQPKVQAAWKTLQTAVNSLYDNEMDKYGKNKYPGLKQLIDKKEGLFRKNMMGKRVNFAARSVISPDPNILVDQIGVPLVFAKKLTYPQPVTPFNLQQLREAVANGPDKYPGAVSIVYDDGMTVSLLKESVRQNIAARLSYMPRTNRHAPTKQDTPLVTIVNRHLLTGDVLLFNRQPTLHKPSIMAFRARVLPNEKGFRLHYANCKSFNADFDGDEMNAHLPQSELARSEAYNIASVNFQYLVPKDGSPLGGLIQDHVVAVCILTRRDQFYDKERYHELVYCALYFLDKPLKLEKPAVIKPEQLWTGKQVITTIIKNCIPDGKLPPTLNIKSKIGPKILNIDPEYEILSDCNVVIRNGELMTGFMDKSNIGATQYGLVHTCYELYGGETSSNLMSAFARLSTWYLQLYEGFTLGIGDILVEDDANEDRQQLITNSLTVGPDSAKEALGLTGEVSEDKLVEKLREAHSDRDPLPMKKLDAAMKTRTDNIASSISGRCLPEGLIRRFPDNNLQMMIQSGAKGGTVNALQISCLLGQIELEGRRVPLSMSGRSLPSFKPYDTSPKAGGFVSGRFLTGIQPQEFFFHCMAGREGLIDTAVKTSRSGYLQRCLIKHLEGLTVQYDQTVRDSCGSVIQFLYGEDGLDIVKSQMLKEKAFSSLVDNHKIIGPSDNELAILNKAKEDYEAEVISRANDVQEWMERRDDIKDAHRVRGSGFQDFIEHKLNEVLDEVKMDVVDDSKPDKANTSASSTGSRSRKYGEIFDAWYALSFKEKKKWNKSWEVYPDPLTSLMNPASHFGVVPEKLDEIIGEFVKKNPKLIIDPATLLGVGGDEDENGTKYESFVACDENPELSKSILTHWNQSVVTPWEKPKMTKHEFYNLCYNLYMKMLAQPGEAVGLLAAQSIGEPSTQMTLNTFHFAGRGEMNVTLGIPRLREILMTASAKIGTPSMDLPLLKTMYDENGDELDESAIEEQAKRVKLALNTVRLSDVLEYVDIVEQVVDSGMDQVPLQGRNLRGGKKKPQITTPTGAKSVKYDITFHLLQSKYYKHEFKCNSSKIMTYIEDVFVTHLIEAMSKRQKRLLTADKMFDLASKRMMRDPAMKGAANGNTVESARDDPEEKDLEEYNAKADEKEKAKEEESSSEEEDDGDGDNTTQRMKNRRNQDLDYEEPEDDDLEVADDDAKAADAEEGDKEILEDDEDKPSQPPLAEDDFSAINASAAAATKDEEEEEAEEKPRKVKTAPPSTTQPNPTTSTASFSSSGKPFIIEFDPKRKRWCTVKLSVSLSTTRLDMGALIFSEAKNAYVHRVGNIQRALIVKDVDAKSRGGKCDKMIKTEGVSLLSLVRYNHILDLNAIYSNDIHAIANTYGIEAASKAIRREMANVFAVYGIEVDPRHLSLIADYMTYNGSIRGMNRMSMEASASPFQQMSFESTIRYLKWAAIMGLYDDIKSPSATLVFGRLARCGTGLFSMLADSSNRLKPPEARKEVNPEPETEWW